MGIRTTSALTAVTVLAPLLAGPSEAQKAGHVVVASSFADPKDVADYRRCVEQGRRDCLAVGDNGVGLWGDDTTDEDHPASVLPRGQWRSRWGGGSAARGKPIVVTYRGSTATCALLDTLPSRPKHHVGIDLNPGAAKALGLTPPFLVPGVGWRWAE